MQWRICCPASASERSGGAAAWCQLLAQRSPCCSLRVSQAMRASRDLQGHLVRMQKIFGDLEQVPSPLLQAIGGVSFGLRPA